MRATASLALLALATGSTQAIFCFVKEKKCLPGVELSLDYDQIPELLGISVSKSSTMTATGTASSSVSSTMSSSTSSTMTVAEPTPAVNTSSSALPPTGGAGVLGDILPRVNGTAAAAAASPTVMATTASPAAPSTMAMSAAAPASAVPAVASAPAPAPVATAPMTFASPSSVVPDFVRDLIPRGDEIAKPAAYESVDHPVESKIAASAYHAPELLPVPDANIESPRFNLTTGQAPAAPPAYTQQVQSYPSSTSHAAEIPSAYVKPVSYTPAQSSVTVTATYSSTKEEDTTTTVTEWTTVTPTQTIELPKSSSSKKEVHTSTQPKPTVPLKETHVIETHAIKTYPVETHAVEMQSVKTHAVETKSVETHAVKTYAVETHDTALPKPSAPQTEIPGTVRLTKTVDAYVSPPTTLSFSTVPSYTAAQKPSEVPVVSYAPVHSKAENYPVPSNATSTQPASYVQPTEARPTVYVTPLPAMNSSMSRTQNSTRMQSPEQYTGAASANALDFAFVVAAGIAAMMVL